MSDIKKYYYLKLKDNFYESDAMIILESMENGYLYSNILMKMYLRSLKTDGRLMFNDRIPYNAQMLSKIVGHNKDIVEKAIKIFKELDLIEILDNGAIYMLDIQNYIGKSSDDADRKRIYRERIKDEKTLIGQMSDKCPDKSPLEIEIDIEKDIEINNNIYIPQKSEFEKEFEELWKIYPNKQGKKNALTKYIKARKSGTTYEEVVEGLKKYLLYCFQNKDWYKPKNGETWFNKQSWNDELAIKTNDTKSLSELGILDFSKFKD